MGLCCIIDIFWKYMVKVESRGEKIVLWLISFFWFVRFIIYFLIDCKWGGVRIILGDIGFNDWFDFYIYWFWFCLLLEYDFCLIIFLLFGFLFGCKLIKFY